MLSLDKEYLQTAYLSPLTRRSIQKEAIGKVPANKKSAVEIRDLRWAIAR